MSRAPDFDAMYADDPDPWGVATRWYERRKMSVLLAALPREHYETAWEPGCGAGVVSQALAGRVDHLTATDGSPVAVRLAGQRCEDLLGVDVLLSQLPEVPLAAPVQLVVVAEFLYYVPDLAPALDALWSAAAPDADMVFLHWAHLPHDAWRSGPSMHAQIGLDAMRRDFTKVVSHVDADFLLDVYKRAA